MRKDHIEKTKGARVMKCEVCGVEAKDVKPRIVEINARGDRKYNESKILCENCQKKSYLS